MFIERWVSSSALFTFLLDAMPGVTYSHTSFITLAPGDQNWTLHLNLFHFSMLLKIRHLWQIKLVIIRQRCLICAVPLTSNTLYPFSALHNHQWSGAPCLFVENYFVKNHFVENHFADKHFADVLMFDATINKSPHSQCL